MRAQHFKTKLVLISDVIHWFGPTILLDNRTFPIFIQELNVYVNLVYSIIAEKEVHEDDEYLLLFYISIGRNIFLASDSSAKTILVLIIRRIHFSLEVNLLSGKNVSI